MKKIFKDKTAWMLTLMVAMMAIMATSAFAAGEPIDMATTVTSSVQTAVTSTISMFAALLPIALTIFASTWGVKKAIRFFKGAAN